MERGKVCATPKALKHKNATSEESGLIGGRGSRSVSNLTHEKAEEIEANKQHFLAVAFGRVVVQGRAASVLALGGNRFVVFVILHRAGGIALPKRGLERHGAQGNPADGAVLPAGFWPRRFVLRKEEEEEGAGCSADFCCCCLAVGPLNLYRVPPLPSQASKGEGNKACGSL